MDAMLHLLRRLLPVLLVGAAFAGVAGCSSSIGSDATIDNDIGYQPGNGGINTYAVGHRALAGDVEGTTLAGTQVSLSSYRGKIVVVNFWASNCPPCRAEAQAFNQVAKDDKDKGVAFLGIDERDGKAQAEAFEADHHVAFPSIFDRNGALALDFPHATPSSTPSTIIIDRTGHIALKVNGALDYTHLVSVVNAVRSERV
jgi:peroxiredoxin